MAGDRLHDPADDDHPPPAARTRSWRAAVGSDVKGKISAVLYVAAIPLAFVNQWIADALYVAVALMWLVPDRRIEAKLERT